jgi:hypothetical protein
LSLQTVPQALHRGELKAVVMTVLAGGELGHGAEPPDLLAAPPTQEKQSALPAPSITPLICLEAAMCPNRMY